MGGEGGRALRRRLGVALAALLVPAAAGLAVAAALLVGRSAEATVVVAGPLGEWAALAGLAAAAATAAAVTAWAWQARARRVEAARVGAQLAEERRRFLLRLDHELKTPLQVLGNGLENLGGSPLAAEQAGQIAAMAAQAERLRRLNAGLRRLAELEARPLDLGPVEPAALLEQAVAAARAHPHGGPERPSLSLPLALPLPTLWADEHLLLLALHNLLDNALKFSRCEDRVEVRAFAADRLVLIEVHDTGPGIPDDELPLIWDELYRGRTALSTPGSGLGLSLAQTIIARHGGQVAAQSRPGRGTIFTVRLPVARTGR